MRNVTILSGSKSKRLAKNIAEKITSLTSGLPTTWTLNARDIIFSYSENKFDTFSDGENSVQLEESFRGHIVFYVQSAIGNDSIIETILTLDALRRNGAEKVYLVMPYYLYCRQDKKDGPRGAVGAKVFADIYQNLGIDGIITVDIHSSAIEGFYNIAFINVNGVSIFSNMLKNLTDKKWTICSPDQGGTVRASKFAERMETNMVTIIKKRLKPNEIHSMQLIGDVKDQNVLIVDDIADTCGTLSKATKYLYENGALSVSAVITHPILSGKAHENLKNSGLKSLFVTDTINIEHQIDSKWIKENDKNECFEYDNGFKIEVISSADILSKTILSMCINSSVHAINETK